MNAIMFMTLGNVYVWLSLKKDKKDFETNYEEPRDERRMK